MEIRRIRTEDAESFLSLQKQLDKETSFMLFEPDERKITTESLREHLQRTVEADNEEIYAAEVDGCLVGYLYVEGGKVKRNKYTAYVVIGVLKSFHRKGIGTRLFQALDEWAKDHCIRRLELTVMEHNRAAMMLYANAGFKVEGMRKQSLFVDGKFVNEFYMAKIIDHDVQGRHLTE